MSLRTVITGMLLVGCGCYVLLRRRENPGQPKQVYGLEPMQDVLGDGFGSAVHWVVFVVAPFAVGGYALLSGLGLDRRWEREPTSEPRAKLERTPEQQAAFELMMAQMRLSSAGFRVSTLEGGKGLRVSADRFAAAIVELETGWRVVCLDDQSFDVTSLIEAEAKILDCQQPR